MQYTTRGQIKPGQVQVYNCAPHNEELHVVAFGPVVIMSDKPDELLEMIRTAATKLAELMKETGNA